MLARGKVLLNPVVKRRFDPLRVLPNTKRPPVDNYRRLFFQVIWLWI